VLWLTLTVDKKVVSTNFVSFSRPKHLKVQKPSFEHTIKQDGDNFIVEISSNVVSLWTWIELKNTQAKYSDRFFHLRPGIGEKIVITPKKKLTLEQVEKKLVMRSLYDTWAV
jgi:hypothetical protein